MKIDFIVKLGFCSWKFVWWKFEDALERNLIEIRTLATTIQHLLPIGPFEPAVQSNFFLCYGNFVTLLYFPNEHCEAKKTVVYQSLMKLFGFLNHVSPFKKKKKNSGHLNEKALLLMHRWCFPVKTHICQTISKHIKFNEWLYWKYDTVKKEPFYNLGFI